VGHQFENLLSFLKMAGLPSQVINDQPQNERYWEVLSGDSVFFSCFALLSIIYLFYFVCLFVYLFTGILR